jgi:hypothetical protein
MITTKLEFAVECCADRRIGGHGYLCGYTGTRYSSRCKPTNSSHDCGYSTFPGCPMDGGPEVIDQTATSGTNQTDESEFLFLVAPAKRGGPSAADTVLAALGARFRGHDGKGAGTIR